MTLDVKGVIQSLQSGSWLSLALVKADEKRATGGEIMRLPRCRLSRRAARQQMATHNQPSAQATKHANHWWNKTLNVELPSGRIISIHPLFVFEVNGRAVI
jgi:hypothetical protein